MRDAEMILIQTAKAKEKRRMVSGASNTMEIERKNIEAITNLEKRAKLDREAGKDNILVQM